MQNGQKFEKAEIEIIHIITDVICASFKYDFGIDTPLDEWD